MPKVRQLSNIYLRGALSNITMKRLTKEQIKKVNEISDFISNHAVLNGHKYNFITQLGKTIGCDYKDYLCAKQDYDIAIWRAVVYLLYHSSYEFICQNCNSQSYNSASGNKVKFNREYEICPNCNIVKVIQDEVTEYMDVNVYEEKCKKLYEAKQPIPKAESPIQFNSLIPKHQNPEQILNDDEQLKKYFGQFIWNYFRQIIRENKITKSNNRKQKILCTADLAIIHTIEDLLRKHSISYNYNPNDDQYKIYFNTNLTSINFTNDLSVELRNIKAKTNITVFPNYLQIQPTSDYKLYEIMIKEQEVIQSISDFIKEGQTENIVDYIPEDDVEAEIGYKLETNDRLDDIRSNLPDCKCQKMFDLLVGGNEIYDEFINLYPTGVNPKNGLPRSVRIADYLKCSSSEIKRYKKIIAHTMLK